MRFVETYIWINRPPEAVFDFHANHANRAAWHEHVIRSEKIKPPPLAIGSRFAIEAVTAGRPFAN